MSYPRQDKVIERLENQNRQALRKIIKSGSSKIQGLWEDSKRLMRAGIREFYRQDFGRSTWNISLAARRGTLHKIDSMIGRVLEDFQHESMTVASRHFKELYRQSVLRGAYILDMVTPDSFKVHLPRNRMFTEAAIFTYQGPDADTAWKVRWSAWMDAYRSAINSNLRMGALNDSEASDAEDEVNATRAGSPAYETGDALDRIFLTQAISIQTMAHLDLSEANEEMGLEEIWQTSFSARVCDICDDNKGLTREEADDDIPAHPNCECYWRLVPANWADLLRSGDADDEKLARWMDANGVVPSSMIVRNDDGDPVGRVIVKFEDWMEGQPLVAMLR